MKFPRYSCGIFAAFQFAIPVRAAEPEPLPNIVVILADDLGYSDLSCNDPMQDVKTPQLDRMAAEGMRFTHCYSGPICTPSRVNLMTGKWSFRNYAKFGYLDTAEDTFANHLKRGGYATAIAGKWQLNAARPKDRATKDLGFKAPAHFGFDEYCLWQLTQYGEGENPRHRNPYLDTAGARMKLPDGSCGPQVCTEFLMDFMTRQVEAKKPFLVYAAEILPHWPYEPTPDSPEWGKEVLVDRKSQIAYMDKNVGRILDHLKALGVDRNTLVVFIGDNGNKDKGKLVDGGTHVPMIARWPGTTSAGKVADTLVDFSDFFATFLDLANLTVPSERNVDGTSLAPLLAGRVKSMDKFAHCLLAQPDGWVRDRRYKLYMSGRFYDIQADPKELTPLAPGELTAEQRPAYDALRRHVDAKVAPDYPKAPGNKGIKNPSMGSLLTETMPSLLSH